MSRWGSPDAGSGRGRVATAQPNIWRNAGWALLQALALVALGYAGWRVVGSTTYRIDIDVYRMGGQAWLDNHPLYSPDVKFHTPIGLNLPFTYPPLAAVIFAPFAWLGMPAASITITLITLALLLVSLMIVLTRMNVWETSRLVPGPAWLRRWWLTALIVAWATLYWEPIEANFAFGQINVVLMTLVIAECVPRRTPWPNRSMFKSRLATNPATPPPKCPAALIPGSELTKMPRRTQNPSWPNSQLEAWPMLWR